jgi:hypothetical protein
MRLIFGSLLKFSTRLIIGWEFLGEFGGLAVREVRVAEETATWPYFV